MRTLADKNETSRVNARAALAAYRATGGQDEDDGAAIGDLITDDLLILYAEREQRNGEHEDTETMLDRAVRDWQYETDVANADEPC